MEEGFVAQIQKFIQERYNDKLEAFDKKAGSSTGDTASDTEEGIRQKRKELAEKYNPETWITAATVRAKQVQFATHVLKFTNSEAKGTSLYCQNGYPQAPLMKPYEVLSTSSLGSFEDDAVGNAAALDVIGFLQIESNGKTLMDMIESGDMAPLASFARDNTMLAEWQRGFSQVRAKVNPSSHTLGKQVYYPVMLDKYHLLAPLFASCLAHEIFLKIEEVRYGEAAKEARKARREKRFSEATTVDYIGVGRQKFGGSQPQNVSLLNSKRRGATYLLSCAPPRWESIGKPPIGATTIFSRGLLGYRARHNLQKLKKFIERYLDVSNNRDIRKERDEVLDLISDDVLQYAAEIQSLRQYAGWSANPECKLIDAERLWLDPNRGLQDKDFQLKRDSGEWRDEIAEAIAKWICKTVGTKEAVLGDVEGKYLEDLVIGRLKQFDASLEMFS